MAQTEEYTIKSSVRVFDGQLIRFTHLSRETQCTMTCAVYVPPTSESSSKIPALMYLSGLTCTDENVCQKGGAFRALAENRIAFICPDTSPRNLNIPGEDDTWDFGTGAGFYLVTNYSISRFSHNLYAGCNGESLVCQLSHVFVCFPGTPRCGRLHFPPD